MKKIYFLIALLSASSQAQNIIFPDPNLKAALVNVQYLSESLDSDADGEISIQEAYWSLPLDISNANISDLTGLEHFVFLEELNASGNQLTSIDVSPFTRLHMLKLNGNQISVFNIATAGMTSLMPVELDLRNNPLETVLINNNHQGPSFLLLNGLVMTEPPANLAILGHLQSLAYVGTQATSISIPPYNVHELAVIDAPNVEFISIKSGIPNYLYIKNSPQVAYVCVDGDENYPSEQSIMVDLLPITETDIIVTNNCGVAPYGNFGRLSGIARFDGNGNGCDSGDMAMPINYQINNGTQNIIVSSYSDGNYETLLTEGDYTITPIPENDYFTLTPANATFSLPVDGNEIIQDFCMSPNGVHADIEVTIVPLGVARPGFDSHYKLIYKNKGNVAVTGTISFAYGDTVEFVSAVPDISSQSVQLLNWNFADLQPFEQREIIITMNVNSPVETPAVNDGDWLLYNVSGTTGIADSTPEDNTMSLNQIVVNSFDPNDKTCLEGNAIAPSMVGKYVHYQIRFENTGSANAENIIVKDMVDMDKFDITSLIPLDASHDFYTRIENNKVEFIFENIQLPFDDANNDGYVMFKIKTKPTLVVGDSFSNSASIYFDYNHPIVTDPAVTNIELLATKDFDFADEFALFPNPTNNILNIQSKGKAQIQSIDIYNTLGQLVLAITNAQKVSKIDVSDLALGNYFIKVKTDRGTSNARFVKN